MDAGAGREGADPGSGSTRTCVSQRARSGAPPDRGERLFLKVRKVDRPDPDENSASGLQFVLGFCFGVGKGFESMGCGKKRKRKKIATHKRKKRLRKNRHKKRLWQK
jgi:hypothetical protein